MDSTVPAELFDVLVEGVRLPSGAMEGLSGLRIQQSLSQPTLCELYFRNPPGDTPALEALTPGQSLSVSLAANPESLFKGTLTAVEYTYTPQNQGEIYLRGYDDLHKLRRSQNIRAFTNARTLEILNTVCRENGLDRPYVVDKLPSEVFTWPRLIQHDQTDLDFITHLAAQEGYYLFMRGSAPLLLNLSGLTDKPISLELGQNLIDASLEVNYAAACRRVTVEGWNPETVEKITGSANRPRSGRQVAGRARSAASLTGEIALNNRTLVDRRHANAIAQGELDRRFAAEVTLRGSAFGSPALYPGRKVTIRDVSPAVAGTYVLCKATHIFDADGYHTEFSSEPPSPAVHAPRSIATFGMVLSVDDPDRQGRARLALPAYNNLEIGWMPVTMPGAGRNHGFVILPSVGDKVLVLLQDENPGMGVVLGGMFGANGMPDIGMNDIGYQNSFLWRTDANQKIQFKQGLTTDSIRIQNAAGAYIELDGGHITIGASSVDFEQT